MADKRILFIHPGMSTFVRQDFDSLCTEFSVRNFFYQPGKSLIKNLRGQIRLFSWLSFQIWWCDYVFIWFADYHSALPVIFAKLLRKKSIIVIGGYEVSYFPEIGYGSRSNPLRFYLTKFSIKNANMNLPVSNFVETEMYKLFGEVNSIMVHNGVQISENSKLKNNREGFLTVAVCSDEQRYRLKGIDLYIAAATHFPDEKFIIVGGSKEFILQKTSLPENVTIHPPLFSDELSNYYSRAKYYCQFSMVESFGLAVVEAMSYGCIPIVVDRGALKEVVDDYGIIIKQREIQDIVNGISSALNSEYDSKPSTEIVKKNYLFKKRGELLADVIRQYQLNV
jgi:glycosyltransferase involved in cell wall biosynthesis